jgi:hypothetical protein
MVFKLSESAAGKWPARGGLNGATRLPELITGVVLTNGETTETCAA